MELYIFDNTYAQIAVITEADSVLWQKKYNDAGECEICLACNTEMLDLLKQGHYIYRYDDDMFCKIKTVEIDTNEETGDQLIVTAPDICTILSGRIVRWQTVYSGTVAGYVLKLLNDNVISPAQSQRRIPNFVVDTSNFTQLTAKIEVSAHTEDLLQAIVTACKTANYGFRVSYDIERGQLVFRLIQGENKAINTADTYIEFSPSFSNILTTHYKNDSTNRKNLVYVGYKNAAEEMLLLSLHNEDAEPTGENREEVYVDGTGTSRNITREELLQLFPDLSEVCVTINEKKYKNYYTTVSGVEELVAVGQKNDEESAESITVTDYCYIILIRNIGENALAERVITEEFSGEVDVQDTYIYKTDYDIGDIVKIANEYGISAEARIVEVMESEDSENGHTIEPVFEYLS